MTPEGKPLIDYTIETPDNSVGRTKRASSKPSTKPPRPVPPWKEGAIAKFAQGLYETVGGMGEPFDPICGAAFTRVAEPAGKAWEKLAKQHIGVRRFFGYIMSGSTIAEVLIVHAPLALAIVSHHGPFRIAGLDHLGEEFDEQLRQVLDEDT